MTKSIWLSLSVTGRAIAECVELIARRDWLKRRAKVIPGYSLPGKLAVEIRTRFEMLDETQKNAVTGLRDRGTYKTAWSPWLDKHLQSHPGDAEGLEFLNEYFSQNGSASIDRVRRYGHFDYPWQMDHESCGW